MKNIFRALALGLLFLFLCPGISRAQTIKIRVIVEQGHIRLLPDAKSSSIKTAPPGAILFAEEKTGEWFRVFFREAEYNMIGYIHTSEVEKVKSEKEKEEDAKAEKAALEKAAAEKAVADKAAEEKAALEKAAADKKSAADKAASEKAVTQNAATLKAGAESPQPPSSEKRKSRISLKISGGTSSVAGGEINTIRDYYFNTYFPTQAEESVYPVVARGSIAPVHGGYGFGPELVLNLGKIGVGLGMEYIKAADTGTMTFGTRHWTPNVLEFSMSDRLTVIPVKLNIYANLLNFGPMQVRLFGGAGLYFGSLADEWTGVNEKGEACFFTQTAKARKVGFQGGLEFEWNLGDRLSLIANAQGRMIKIDGFSGTAEGTLNWFHPKSGVSENPRSGTLYFYEMQSAPNGPWVPNLVIFEEAPTNENMGLSSKEAVRNVAEAAIDLSGYSVRIGLKYKF